MASVSFQATAGVDSGWRRNDEKLNYLNGKLNRLNLEMPLLENGRLTSADGVRTMRCYIRAMTMINDYLLSPVPQAAAAKKRRAAVAIILLCAAFALSVLAAACTESTDSAPATALPPASPQAAPAATAALLPTDTPAAQPTRPAATVPPAPTAAPIPPTPEPTAVPVGAIPAGALLPTSLLHPEAPFVQLAAGGEQFCGLQEDGAVLCWTPAPGAAPDSLRQPATGQFQQISVGETAFCGLLDNGALRCGEASLNGVSVAPEGNFIAVAAGGQHACALEAGGAAVCWGRSADADADADDNDDGRTTPPPDASFVAIAAGDAHSCGITFDDSLLCWGQNPDGRADPQPGPFQQLALGVNNTCALRPDGTVFCQGDDSAGQSSPPATRFMQIALGPEHGCGVTDAGAVECWGGDWAESAYPAGLFTAVSAGGNTVCGLRPAGYAECWGQDRAPSPYFLTPDAVPVRRSDGVFVNLPVELFSWPDGRIAIVDRKGFITLFADGAEPHTALDIRDRTATDGELGMLSAVLDPQIDEFPFLYVYYHHLATDGGGNPVTKGRVARFPISNGTAAAQDELVILELEVSTINQGGSIRFGPDGMLYWGLGDDNVIGKVQDLSELHGKIIRIDVRGASAEQPYRIPDDNPFVGQSDARPEIWAYGLRDAWRMSFDREGRLWVGDVGWSNKEELSVVVAGANMGWPIIEGDVCLRGFEDLKCTTTPDLTAPVYTYDHNAGRCAITGALANTRYDDTVFFSDLCSGQVWALIGNAAAGWQVQELARFDDLVVSLSTDANGEVYVLTFGEGGVYRLDFAE